MHSLPSLPRSSLLGQIWQKAEGGIEEIGGIFELLTKVLIAGTAVGTVLGAAVVFNYLKRAGITAVFPDLIGRPQFLAALAFFALVGLVAFGGLLTLPLAIYRAGKLKIADGLTNPTERLISSTWNGTIDWGVLMLIHGLWVIGFFQEWNPTVALLVPVLGAIFWVLFGARGKLSRFETLSTLAVIYLALLMAPLVSYFLLKISAVLSDHFEGHLIATFSAIALYSFVGAVSLNAKQMSAAWMVVYFALMAFVVMGERIPANVVEALGAGNYVGQWIGTVERAEIVESTLGVTCGDKKSGYVVCGPVKFLVDVPGVAVIAAARDDYDSVLVWRGEQVKLLRTAADTN